MPRYRLVWLSCFLILSLGSMASPGAEQKDVKDVVKRMSGQFEILPSSPLNDGWKKLALESLARIDKKLDSPKKGGKGAEVRQDLALVRWRDCVVALKKGNLVTSQVLVYTTVPIGSLPILPDTAKLPGEMVPGLQLVACPGEVKPVSLVLWAALEIPEVTVSVTDLQGPWAAIPASQVSVRFVRQWALQDASSVPAVLPRGRNQQVWCVVQVPETMGSGTYNGSIVLCGAGAELGRLPVSLEVLPFRLEPFPSGQEGRLYGARPSSEHLDPKLCRMGHGIQFWRAQRSPGQVQASATLPEGGKESLLLEGLREGETDVRYILTLEKEIERVLGKGNGVGTGEGEKVGMGEGEKVGMGEGEKVGMGEGEKKASEALEWLHGLDEQDEDLDGMRGRVIRFLLTLRNY